MNRPLQLRRAGGFLALLLPVLVSVAVPAARSDAAEDQKVATATVTEGLKTIGRAGAEIVGYAGKEKAKAEQEAKGIEPIWSMIGGTIRANDSSAYEAFEAALDDLTAAATAGDAKKAEAAAGALGSVTKAYVAKFSAGAAPTAGAARTADAAPRPDAPAGSGERTEAAAGALGSVTKAYVAKFSAGAAPTAGAARTADAAPKPDASAASGERTAAAATEAGDATLARTGPSSRLAALAGVAFGPGGLALIGGARRRRAATTA